MCTTKVKEDHVTFERTGVNTVETIRLCAAHVMERTDESNSSTWLTKAFQHHPVQFLFIDYKDILHECLSTRPKFVRHTRGSGVNEDMC